jgi:S-(hydroxymethyl)mycothiol dehydrogenase
MIHRVQGVVAREPHAPVTLEGVLVPDPGPGEALVRVEACGVCHTDLHYREGSISDGFPFLLGHEAAGEVVEVGADVRDLEVGAFVILNWRAVCGTCRSCRRGRPQYCFSTFNATQKMRLEDGTPLSPALGIGAFASLTLVAAGQCTKVPRVRAEAAGLLGCGVMAGIGAAMRTGEVGPGDSVAVFGCGGVGAAAIVGAKLMGATTIIAVDIDDRKLDGALAFGATHTVNSAREDPVAAVRAASNSFGVDVAIEAVGHPEVFEQAFFARDLAGIVVQVGVPTPEMRLPDLAMIDFFGRGGSLRPSWYGDCLPDRDFPMLIELYQQGRLDLDGFVSEVIGIADVEGAFSKMSRGEVLRSVVSLR